MLELYQETGKEISFYWNAITVYTYAYRGHHTNGSRLTAIQMSVQCKQPYMHMTGHIAIIIIMSISGDHACKAQGIIHADSDAPSTSKKLHICESTGMHNKHFVYTHTLSHKLTQCAHTDMLDKPAHSDCSHVVHNRAFLTQYRCTYQNTMSTQECIVLSNWITMHPSSPCGS